MNPESTAENRPRRPWVLIAILLLVLAAAAWGVHRLGAKPATRGGAAAAGQVVTVDRATVGDMPEIIAALGTVTPEATVTVLPQLSGYLTAVGYHEGQEVAKGDFLAQIDPRAYQISKQQAEAQLAKDKAVLGQAQADLARYTTLKERKSIADQTWVDQQFLARQAAAAVKADEAAIAQYALDISYCRITAPVAGRIGLRLVDPGNYVTASSQPGIAVITSTKPTTVVFNVAQKDLARILKRFGAEHSLPVTAWDSDGSAPIATGELYAIGNQVATSTGTVSLRARFANDDERLFPNEFVNIRLLVDTLHDAVLVPTPAVQSGAPGDFVYRVNDDSSVSVRKVTLGPSDGRNTVIRAGLAVGDAVVVDGTDRLSDGTRIRDAAKVQAAARAGATGDARNTGQAGTSGQAGNSGHDGSSGKDAGASHEPPARP